MNQERRTYQKQLLEIKPIESFPNYIKDELKIVSMIPDESATPFGSYIYRLQPYASDLDALQHIKYISEDNTIHTFIKALRRVLKSLDKNHVYSEFKAGYDYNYIFPIGKLSNGIFTIDEKLRETLTQKYNQDFFNIKEYYTMMVALAYVDDHPDDKVIQSMAYDYIFDLIRDKKILRWTKQELLDGYKIISLNQKYMLFDALSDETIVKIDVISLVNYKFVEVTNILFLAYSETDKDGNIEYFPVNVSEQNLHKSGLGPDIEKLYYSNKFYSPFKACKRIYAEMRRIKNYNYLMRIAPIIRHEISALYQIKAELDTFRIILKKVPSKYYIDHINNQLQTIKGRLTYAIEISKIKIIDFSHEIDTICLVSDKEEKSLMIKKLEDSLKSIINFLTISSMNRQGLNPIPTIFLPDKMMYDVNMIRKPEDDPTSIYEQFVKLLG
jgi:hypothetical protein